MSLRKIDLIHVAVLLKKPIRHASHERSTSDNLVVRVTLDDGTVGYGEGVPRPYVTGESIESTFETLSGSDWARAIGNPASYAGLIRALEAISFPETESDPRGMAGNAARCALELAVLDAFGHRFGEPIGSAIRMVEAPGLPWTLGPGRVRYSGAITAGSWWKETVSAYKMRLYGFSQVKLKVGVSGQDDEARLADVRRILGRRVDVRLDANEAWPAAEVVDRLRPLLRFGPSVVEQPVPHCELDSLRGLRSKLGVPVMLDESLCGIPDARRAIERQTADLFNVRLSKCGGFIPSLRIIGMALRHGLGVQLGCHPGETGLLSAAGRHVAANLSGLRYIEGSYDRHILVRNLTREDITFRYGGWAPPLPGPGLGVRPDPAALEQMTVKSTEIAYD